MSSGQRLVAAGVSMIAVFVIGTFGLDLHGWAWVACGIASFLATIPWMVLDWRAQRKVWMSHE